MANKEHLAKLKEGVNAWNAWREENPDIRPDLSDAELTRMDLRKANLIGANLFGANLSKKNLGEANFSVADLRGADLSEADLSEAILGGFYTRNNYIKGANLSSADLSKANLSGANLMLVDLSKANLCGVNFNGAIMWKANLSGLNLSGLYLCDVDLCEANLSKVDLSESDLSRAKLVGANLSKADLIGTDLSGANLSEADFSGANLSVANFSRAILRYADLSGVDLCDVDHIYFDSNYIKDARFSPNARDPWSVLRRNYTGPRMIFNVLCLVAFLLPYIVKTIGLVALNNLENHEYTSHLISKFENSEIALQSINHDKSEIDESRKQSPIINGKRYRIYQILIGWDQGWTYWILSLVLIIYNLARALLTYFVGALREEEERSGYTPSLNGKVLYSTSLDNILPISHHFRWRLFRVHLFSYGWMIYLHYFVQAALLISLISFAWHGYHWLTAEVWIPQID